MSADDIQLTSTETAISIGNFGYALRSQLSWTHHRRTTEVVREILKLREMHFP